VQPLASC